MNATEELLTSYIKKLEDKIQQRIKRELELTLKIIDLEYKLKALEIHRT
jgi:hypothetical protein